MWYMYPRVYSQEFSRVNQQYLIEALPLRLEGEFLEVSLPVNKNLRLQSVLFGGFIFLEGTVKRLLYLSMVIFNRSNYAFTLLKYVFLYQLLIERTGARCIECPVIISKVSSWTPDGVDVSFKIMNRSAFGRGIWRVSVCQLNLKNVITAHE